MQQQVHNRKKKANGQKPLTPIEKLLEEKVDLRAKCRLQEEKLREDFDYIQDNASGLLLSGLSSLLFPSRHPASKKGDASSQAIRSNGESTANGTVATRGNTDKQEASISFSDLLDASKSLLPIVWEVVQPMLITWGIRKASSLFVGLFSKNKKGISRR